MSRGGGGARRGFGGTHGATPRGSWRVSGLSDFAAGVSWPAVVGPPVLLGDGFTSIDDVLSFEERQAIVRGYASTAGFAREQVNKAA